MTEPKRFIFLAAVIASASLSFMLWSLISDRSAILENGSEILLKTQPIDPRDLLRGRYVRLDFEAETIPASDADRFDLPEGESFFNDDAFVRFEPGNSGFHEVAELSIGKPDDLSGWMAVRFSRFPSNREIRFYFPVDRYYTNEKIAPELERRMREGALTEVVLALWNGDAQIKSFRQDGETVLVEPLF
ncbi:MAG: GDYXXLXY domain-containing protein [Pseudomonadota bacterium]